MFHNVGLRGILLLWIAFANYAFSWVATSRNSFRFEKRSLSHKDTLTVENRKSTEKTILQSSVGEACGLNYDEPVFRPPAEWRSLILQVTIGCSWNQCTFCEMYQNKDFRAKPIEEIIVELDQVVDAGGGAYVRDVFLADGDAMMLPTGRLEMILDAIQERFPRVRRVSSYCLPRNLRGKSVESLSKLRSKGLSLVYVGCESGDNTVLAAVRKGETFDSSIEALNRLQEAGIKRSVMILLGLGGKEHTVNHAIQSAVLCNKAKPEFLSVLTTSFPMGKRRMEEGYQKILPTVENIDISVSGSEDAFQELNARESLEELKLFLESIDISRESGRTIFRSDHASNYLVLKGRLGRDKEKFLEQLQYVLDSPPEDDVVNLRPEWARGL